MFVSAKLPGYIRIAGSDDDVIEKYILWTNNHAGNALSAYLTAIRVVCNNTLTASFKDMKSGFTIKHTKNVLGRVDALGNMFGFVRDYNDEFGRMLNRLAKLQITEAVEEKFVADLLLTSDELKLLGTKDGISQGKIRAITSMRNAIHKAPGQNMHRGTALWLYNGVTSYLQNVKSYRSPSRKMAGIMLGGEEAATTQRAFTQLISMA